MKILKTNSLNFQIYIVSAILFLILTFFITITIKRSFEERRVAEEYTIKNGISSHLNAAAAWQAIERGCGATILGSGEGDSSPLFSNFLEVIERGDSEVLQAEEQMERLLRVTGNNTLIRPLDKWHKGYEDLVRARPKIATNDISKEEWLYTATLNINNEFDLRNIVFAPQKMGEKILYLNNVLRQNITRLCEYAGLERALVGNIIASGKPLTQETSNEIENYRSIVEQSLNQLLVIKDLQLTSNQIKKAIEDFEKEFLQSFNILREEVFTSSRDQQLEIEASYVQNTKRKEIFRNYFSIISNDLLNMSNQKSIKTLARALSGQEDIDLSKKLHEVEKLFETFSQVKKTLCRIRYLDALGNERVRVDFDGRVTKKVSGEQLHDRSDKSYFKETIVLQPGAVYISPLNLKMEEGKIEIPYKPIIRFATPVIEDGKSSGVLIFNVLANTPFFLHRVIKKEGKGDYILANQDGFYLNHPYEVKEWGMVVLLNKSHHNVRLDYPNAGDQILSGKKGSVLFASGKILVYEPFFLKSDGSGNRFWVIMKEVKPVEYPVDATTWFERATKAINTGIAISNIAGAEADAVMLEMAVSAKRDVIMSFSLFVACISIFVFFIRWSRSRILKPITRLTDITQRISEGDYAYQFEVNTKDEIGLLATNFNKMAKGLTNEITERRRGEEMIRKLTSAVEQNPGTVIITDTKGTIEYVNRKFTQLTGYTFTESLGKNPRILKSGKTSPTLYKNLWQTILSGNEWCGKFCNKKKSGELYWESASISPVKGADGSITHFVAVKEDITERMKAERRLKAQHLVTQLLAESATAKEAYSKIIQAICIALEWDLGEIWLYHHYDRVLHCSEIWYQPSFEASEFISSSATITFAPGVGLPGRVFSSAKAAWISDVVQDMNFPRASVAFKEGLHGAFGFPIVSGGEVLGTTSFYSQEIRPPDKEMLDMMSSIGNQIGLFIKRKQAEKLLKESEERYRKLIETAQDPIVCSIGGKIVDWNCSAEKVFGYTKREILGKPIEDLVPKKYKSGQKEEGGLFSETGQTVEVLGVTKEEVEIPIELSVTAQEFGNNQSFSMAIIRDLTSRKRMESKLLQSEKLKAMGVMTSGISHEFNNILAIIKGYALLLEGKYRDHEEVNDKLTVILKSANDGAEIVSRMLEFTRLEPDKTEFFPVDVKELLQQVIDFSMPRWKTISQAKGITYRIDKKGVEEVPKVLGNDTELREVMLNIINNSLDAMPEGGCLSFRTWNRNDDLFFSISDTGEGMYEDVRKNIFDPFLTTKLPDGTGLGMSVSYGIIKRHGGNIEVESEIGKGTTITIQLPVSKNEHYFDADFTQSHGIQRRNLHILVVDDEKAVCDFLSEFLSQEGQSVKSVCSGREAMKLLKNESFDLLLCDLVMPEISGREIVKLLDTLDKRPKVGLITGWSEEIVTAEEELHVDFLIKKPFDFSLLSKHINEVLA